MRLRLSEGLRAALVRPETLLILVRAAPGRALPLAQALTAQLDQFGAPPGTYVTEPIPVPVASGQTAALFTAGLSALQGRDLTDLPGRLAAWAADVVPGDEEAELDLAPPISERYLAFAGFGPVVRASVRMPPILEPVPGEPDRSGGVLSRLAAAWVTAPGVTAPGQVTADELLLHVYGTDLPLIPGQVEPTLAAAFLASQPVVALRSDFATWARAAAVFSGPRSIAPEAALNWAAASPSSDDLVTAMREQRELLRQHGPAVAWAQVAVAPNAYQLLQAGWDPQTAPQHPEHAPMPGLVADVGLPAPGWFQVLSSGHLDRLGGVPAGAAEIGGGRYELTIGTPEQWLPGHPDGARIRAEAAALLGRAMLDADQAEAAHRAAAQRIRQARAGERPRHG